MPKISVIIPVYNTENYLRECLDSVINQTFKDIEIICINDGSTDGSLHILNEYATKDNRIKVISQENRGQSVARNIGLNNISGEYVYFIDSDDYIKPTLFEYAMNIFNNFDVDYFCFGSKTFCDGVSAQPLDSMNEYIRIKRDGIFNLDFDIGLNTNIHVCMKFFKASIIKEHNIQFVENLLYEDIYFTWYYFFVSQKAYFDDEVYYYYRINPNSTMESTTKNKTFKTGIDHMYNWHELMLTISKDKELFIKNYNNLCHLLNNYTYRTKEMVPASDKYKVELLKIDYRNELDSIKNKFEEEIIKELTRPLEYSFLERIFSMKNSRDRKHKVICCCGIKLKIKRRNK